MNYNSIFKLPYRCWIEKKLTKAFFLKNYTLTASEKKKLNIQIISMIWLANIKPDNSNISAVISDTYNYNEIQIISVQVQEGEVDKNGSSYAEFIHKYIPTQTVVIVEDESQFLISLADKRINKVDKSKRTIEQYLNSPLLSKLYKSEVAMSFFDSLAFGSLDNTNLETTHKSYLDAVTQLKASIYTGQYLNKKRIRTEQDIHIITSIEDLQDQIVNLQRQIKKEEQLSQKVQLNISIQNKRNEIELLKSKL